jgi:hypothetical protein
MKVRARSDGDAAWIADLLRSHWGSTVVAVHGEAIDALSLPALVAGEREGLATYRLHGDEAELVRGVSSPLSRSRPRTASRSATKSICAGSCERPVDRFWHRLGGRSLRRDRRNRSAA